MKIKTEQESSIYDALWMYRLKVVYNIGENLEPLKV